ncbi:MAG: DUF7507 domain-containing protein, partial [Hyphomicrobiaceae bacterium]
YEYRITNTGNVKLTHLTLWDNNVDKQPRCPSHTIPVNGSVTCKAEHKVTQADIDRGSVKNDAKADTRETGPVRDWLMINLKRKPSMTMKKSTTTPSYSAVGDILKYEYLVTNTGNVKLTGLKLWDNNVDAQPSCPSRTIPINSSVTCKAEHEVTQADINRGSVKNDAKAYTREADPASDWLMINIKREPSMTVAKSANPTTYSAVGDQIAYSYVLTNTGNVTLTNIVMSDDQPVTGLSCPATTLAPAGTMTCTSTGTITQANINAGSLTNVGTATSDEAPDASGTATVTAVITRGLSLDKETSTEDFASVGDELSYTYLVTNTGNVTVNSPITVSDDRVANVSCPVLPTGGLTPGQSITCTATDTVVEADLVAGSVTNVASASAGGTTSNTDTVTVNRDDDEVRRKTREAIGNFLHRRNDLLLSEEPDRNRLLRRISGWGSGQGCNGADTDDFGRTLKFSANGGSGETIQLSFSTSWSQIAGAHASNTARQAEELGVPMGLGQSGDGSDARTCASGFDVWAEAHFTRFDDGNGNGDLSGHFGVLYLGADYLVNPAFLAGLLIQFDWTDESSPRLLSSVDGHGWMIGPYITARLSENLFFDARVAWGRSDNSVTPSGLLAEHFDTERWLARANLTGNWTTGNWRFTPYASIAYIQDKQESFTNQLGLFIPGQTSSLGRVTFGPEIGYRFRSDSGTLIEPHIKLEGIWDFDQPDDLTVGGFAIGQDDFRARITGGVQITTTEGWRLRAAGSYDGIGQSDFDSWSGQLWLSVPLN